MQAPVPARFSQLANSLADTHVLNRFEPNTGLFGKAWASVLIAISDTESPDIIFTERSRELRNHPGQLAFPGGRRDPGDQGPLGTALREANEEVGLDSKSFRFLGQFPPQSLPVSQFEVVAVVGLWDGMQQLKVVDPGEVASIQRWTIAELSDPENRVMFLHTSRRMGPAWQFGDFFLWGFTAMLLDHLLKIGGWEQPWDRSKIVKVPRRYLDDSPQIQDE